MVEVERDVAGDVEVEPAVAVVVAERAARGPAVDGDARARRDIGEAAALVAVQPVHSEVRDVQILIAVVVEVARAHALSPALVGDAGLGGDVAEPAATEVAIERCRRCRGVLPDAVQRRAVDQVDVLQAVAVVVDRRDAGARDFDDVVLLRAARDVVEAGEPGIGGDVHVAHALRGVRRGRWNGLCGRQVLSGKRRGRERRHAECGAHQRGADSIAPPYCSAFLKASCARSVWPAV